MRPGLTTSEAAWLRSGRDHEVVRAATRAALRRLLAPGVAAPGAIRFTRACRHCGDPAHGKPSAVGVRSTFNVAHTSGVGLIAIGEDGVDVGVDVEGRRRDRGSLELIVDHALSQQEISAIQALRDDARDEALLRIWTAKEAVTKADGRGLLAPLHDLSVAPIVTRPTISTNLGGRRWWVSLLELGRPFVAAVAASEAVDVDVRRWRW